MRRIVGVLASAVLALALSYASATAAGLSFGRPSGDLGSQLMLSLFGETSDSSAAFSAQNGDRASESPLRDMAFRLPAADSSAPFSAGLATSPALMQAQSRCRAFRAQALPIWHAPSMRGCSRRTRGSLRLPNRTIRMRACSTLRKASIRPRISP